MREAEARFKTLGLTNVITRFGDGGEGWPEQAPSTALWSQPRRRTSRRRCSAS